ncbi:MAG: YicC/YloC family endoribonuclease [Terriglobales bacterium]
MPLRSMTGYAQVRGQAGPRLAFALSLKSVNHRFLDLHFRLPSDTDALEMKLRRLLKEKMVRGHVEVTLTLDYASSSGLALNRQLISGYVQAFRSAAQEFGISGEPDLNVVLRMPGAMESASERSGDELENAVMACVEEALARLNQMREEEGRGIERELRERMKHLREAAGGIEVHRGALLKTYADRLQSRMREMFGAQIDKDRILQEAAVLVDRSDIQEELVRLNTHIEHFVALLGGDGEVGKKMDFLLQEMNREANTLLSKTSGLAGEALKITEAGLLMKSEIEKSREQVQNLE